MSAHLSAAAAPFIPPCGHSVCSQCWIDTGDPRCVAIPCKACSGAGCGACYDSGVESFDRVFSLDSDRVGTAFAIRNALPDITLSEALTYADASTIEGRSFRGTMRGFFGLGYSRVDLVFGLAWYFTLWASDRRNSVRGVKLSVCARFESEDIEVRRCYGAIVRKRQPVLTGYERFARRAKRAGRAYPAWPGLWNMPPKGSERATMRAWLASEGIEAACAAYAPEDRGEAYNHMRVMLDAPEVQS